MNFIYTGTCSKREIASDSTRGPCPHALLGRDKGNPIICYSSPPSRASMGTTGSSPHLWGSRGLAGERGVPSSSTLPPLFKSIVSLEEDRAAPLPFQAGPMPTCLWIVKVSRTEVDTDCCVHISPKLQGTFTNSLSSMLESKFFQRKSLRPSVAWLLQAKKCIPLREKIRSPYIKNSSISRSFSHTD